MAKAARLVKLNRRSDPCVFAMIAFPSVDGHRELPGLRNRCATNWDDVLNAYAGEVPLVGILPPSCPQYVTAAMVLASSTFDDPRKCPPDAPGGRWRSLNGRPGSFCTPRTECRQTGSKELWTRMR